MTNPFFFESNFNYEPLVKPIDEGTVQKDLDTLRQKTIDAIKEQISQKDYSRAEVAMATKLSRASISTILASNGHKVSTHRLLLVARRLGLKPLLKFKVEA